MEVRKMPRRLTLAAALITIGTAALAAVPAASAHAIPLRIGPADITHIGMPSAGSSGPVGATTVTSTNWSGYALDGGTYTSVSTTWVQQPVNCSQTPNSYAAFWAGLDGYTSSTVEQDGTLAECVSSGGGHGGRGGRGGSQPTQTAEYMGWYETYPNPMYSFGGTVLVGDTLTSTVTESSPTEFVLTLTDTRPGATKPAWSATTTQKLKKAPALSSAEVIAEAPSGSGGILPLADFGTVSFSSSTVDGSPLDGAIAIDMASRGVPEATPGPLTDGAFSVTWNS